MSEECLKGEQVPQNRNHDSHQSENYHIPGRGRVKSAFTKDERCQCGDDKRPSHQNKCFRVYVLQRDASGVTCLTTVVECDTQCRSWSSEPRDGRNLPPIK